METEWTEDDRKERETWEKERERRKAQEAEAASVRAMAKSTLPGRANSMATKVQYAITCSKAGHDDVTYPAATEDMARQIGEVTAERRCHDSVIVQRIYHVSRTIVETLAEYRDGQLVEPPPRVVPYLRGPFENWRHNEKLPLPDLRDVAEWLRQNADMLEHLQDRQRDISEELHAIQDALTQWQTARESRGVL